MFLINRWYTIAAQASTAFLLLAPLSPRTSRARDERERYPFSLVGADPLIVRSQQRAETCRKIFWGFATDGIAVMFFCDCIIAIRVYAVYEKSKKILYL